MDTKQQKHTTITQTCILLWNWHKWKQMKTWKCTFSYFDVFTSDPGECPLPEPDHRTPDVDHGSPHPVDQAQAQDHEAEVNLTEGVMTEELIAGDGASFQENLI